MKKKKIQADDVFEKSMDRLREYVYENEIERRRWANETWAHSNGKWFRLGRIFIPITGLAALIFLALHCMIRFAQLEGIYYEVNAQAVNAYVYPMLVVMTALVAAVVLTIFGRLRAGSYIAFTCSAAAIIGVCTQLGVYTPDNSNFGEAASILTYFQLSIIIIALFTATAFFSGIVAVIFIKDKRALDRMVSSTLERIVSGGDGLADSGDYSEKINAYLDTQKEKAKKKR